MTSDALFDIYAAWQRAKVVFIATGDNYPDALAAAALARRTEGAVLLTNPRALTSDQAGYLTNAPRVEVDHFYVMGGTAVVSDNVIQQIRAANPTATVERIRGVDRFDTAALLAERFTPTATTAVVATGQNFPDALAAGPFAAANSAPLLLSDDDRPTPALQKEFSRHDYTTRITVGKAGSAALG